jgi:SAM-dependent methyltransferase
VRLSDVVLPFVNDHALGAPVASLRASIVGRAHGRVLEIGAGTGLNFRHYAADTEIVAIEPSSAMRRRAEQRARSADVRARIRVVDADATRLPFDAAAFDAVVATFVLCSLDDLERGLAEVRRVLAPGGAFLLAEHVVSPEPRVRRVQRAAQPIWGSLLGGCRLDRDPIPAIERAGLDVSDLAPTALPLPWIVRAGLVGSARR